MSEEVQDYNDWKRTPEGRRELLACSCLAVADNPDNGAAVAELIGRLANHPLPSGRTGRDYFPAGEWADMLAKATNRACMAEALLRRIREWDMLDLAGDGPHWKKLIDELLAPTV